MHRLTPQSDGTYAEDRENTTTQYALATKDGQDLTYRFIDVYPTREIAESEMERRVTWCRTENVDWDPVLIEVTTAITSRVTATLVPATAGATQ